MAEDTRTRLLVTAMTLFSEKGYDATSIADILKGAGANSGSLYHFFPTKQDLLIEVLKMYRDGIYRALTPPGRRRDPIEKVFAAGAASQGAHLDRSLRPPDRQLR